MKAKKSFVIIIAIAVAIVFISMALELFSVWSLNDLAMSLVLIGVGAGFMIEGGIRKVLSYAKNGLTGEEVTHIITIFVGVITFIVGILRLPLIGINFFAIDVIAGIALLLAIPLVYIQMAVVK